MDDATLIKLLGGPAKVAALLEYDKESGGTQRVHNWTSRGIPDDIRRRLAVHADLAEVLDETTGQRVRRWTLFPNDWYRFWPELIGSPGAPAVPEQQAAA